MLRSPVTNISALAGLIRRLPVEGQALLTLAGSGMVRPERADRMYAMLRAVQRYGAMGATISVAAIRWPARTGLVDELGALTFRDLDLRSNALANRLRERGVGPGTAVGILCRNHRGLLEASYAVLKCGGRALYLNTDFSAPQAMEVCAREEVSLLVADEEFQDVVARVRPGLGRLTAWTDDASAQAGETVESLIASGDPEPPPAPAGHGAVVILTSGTTGSPKGARRGQPRSPSAAAAILSRIPFKAAEATFIASPIHHAWGMGVAALSLGLGSTVVVRRRFDPDATLVALAEHRCTAVAVVPVILNRMLAVGDARIAALDLSSLRIIASSGAQLEAALATRAMDTFGEIVYNLYGSTEVAWATIATPADLRAAPGCAGRPPLGTTVKILDGNGDELPVGCTGRIFVGSGMEFGGYTDGGGKEVVAGLMSTGDLGHFDAAGRLFVDGRDDEMIVSGGENVYPREVEELLAAHDAVLEAAVVGVDDPDFGQRLHAFVVLRPGRSLDAEEVRRHVKAHLARYKVPRDVTFLDELPRTPSGKVLKRRLAAARPDD